VRARLLSAVGSLEYWQGDLPQAIAHYEEALAINEELGDQEAATASIADLAFATRIAGDYERATTLLEEARRRYREGGNELGVADLATPIMLTAVDIGDYDSAAQTLTEAIVYFRGADDRFGLGNCLNSLAYVDYLRGSLTSARAEALECLDIAWESGDLPGIVVVTSLIALLLLESGAEAGGVRVLAISETLGESLGAGVISVATPGREAEFERRRDQARQEHPQDYAEGAVMKLANAVTFTRRALEEAATSIALAQD
jgi:tetratricopeptide (TPR) repeat protein